VILPLRMHKAFHSGRRTVRPENLCSCSAQRMSLTSAGVSARVQIESAVSAGTPSRAASTRHARSASESPCVLVLGRSLAISTQSASVIGSRMTASRRSSASWSGSSPAIADLESTSAQFATLMAAPSSIALRTGIAPFSSFRCAISAEVSSTTAGLLTGSASGFGTTASAGCFCCVRLVFGSRFNAAFGDRLVDQAASWRETDEHAAGPIDRCSASLDYELGRGLGDFECVCHARILARAMPPCNTPITPTALGERVTEQFALGADRHSEGAT